MSQGPRLGWSRQSGGARPARLPLDCLGQPEEPPGRQLRLNLDSAVEVPDLALCAEFQLRPSPRLPAGPVGRVPGLISRPPAALAGPASAVRARCRRRGRRREPASGGTGRGAGTRRRRGAGTQKPALDFLSFPEIVLEVTTSALGAAHLRLRAPVPAHRARPPGPLPESARTLTDVARLAATVATPGTGPEARAGESL
jgi:hypothetical protein